MSSQEKALRQETLYKVVTTHTSHTWAGVLVKMLLGRMDGQGQARQTPYISHQDLGKMYHAAGKRLFLFDYDVRVFLLTFIHVACFVRYIMY
jgi:trehalose 6-phosphate synthase/phosphatase